MGDGGSFVPITQPQRSRAAASLRWMGVLGLVLLALAACRSVRPTAQLGLLAPFEGLHRRAGYAALERVRAVVAEVPVSTTDWLPLALDTSLDSVRSARKLLASPALAAVVGPLMPADGFAVAQVLRDRHWVAPYALDESGFADPGGVAWAEALVRAAAEDAARKGFARLALAGWDPTWPKLDRAKREGFAALPTIYVTSPDAPDSGVALLWLGNAEDGARFIGEYRFKHPDAPVWVGPWIAADSVFFERLAASAAPESPNWNQTYSLAWVDGEYTVWAHSHPTASYYGYLLEHAARAALLPADTGDRSDGASAIGSEWQAVAFQAAMSENGIVWKFVP